MVAYDFGMKRNIVRMLVQAGCRVTVVPSTTSAAAVRELNPDGLFLSNGPGDPAAVGYALETIRQLSGAGLPTFGICLGHQLVGLAYGGPPRSCRTVTAAEITRCATCEPTRSSSPPKTMASRWLARAAASRERPALEVTHLNLNDGTIEGIRHRELPLFAVQYHPEAAPGPHDALPHFAEFMASLGVGRLQSPKPLTDKG